MFRNNDVVRWLGGPWGQMVIYLLIFFVLGFGVMAFFSWVRGPETSKYSPWETANQAATQR